MSSKQFSPAAKLLRQSRLMTMPTPIPPPPTHNIYNPPPSPYPTVQAIATTQASAARGEWGLKRDVPLQTSTSKAYLRYNDLDTWMHMTTIESAHDDVYTLRKWQEMDVPIFQNSKTMIEYSTRTGTSVFDAEKSSETKWRYSGPYLPDLTEGELKEYIDTQVLPRKAEFIEFVAARQKEKRIVQLRAKNANEEQLKRAEGQTEKVDLLALRGDRQYLEQLVLDFLDIPLDSRSYRTHPSAGLHYTRSDAAVRNDPELGPLERRPALNGRPLNYHRVVGPLAGIGGIVAKVNKAPYLDKKKMASFSERSTIEKYTPEFASVSHDGRIQLEVEMRRHPDQRDMGYPQRKKPWSFLTKQNSSLNPRSGIGSQWNHLYEDKSKPDVRSIIAQVSRKNEQMKR